MAVQSKDTIGKYGHAVIMHPALLLPEIVATILANGATLPGLLYTALTINKLFFNEAARLLWYQCGIRGSGVGSTGRVTPGIRHLVAIIERDVGRAQIYANLIHVLVFGYEPEGNSYFGANRWHPQLSQMQFPRLDTASFFALGAYILHYARGLRTLHVAGREEVPGGWLDRLSEQCPSLKSLSLQVYRTSSVDQESFCQFLERSQSLEYLDVAKMSSHWNSRTLRTASLYPHLSRLECPLVLSDWLDTSISGFTSLKSLTTTISDEALELLHRITPDLTFLRLMTASEHILCSASMFTRLKSLDVIVPENGIYSQDLLQLAKSCPNLVEVIIGSERPMGPSSAISDEVMNSFALHLPNLKEVQLAYETRYTGLTIASLYSFGKHCPKLQRLQLPMKFDWHSMAQNVHDRTVVSKSLTNLTFSLGDGHVRLEDCSVEDQKQAENMATSLAHALPALLSFSFQGASPKEEAIIPYIMNIESMRDSEASN